MSENENAQERSEDISRTPELGVFGEGEFIAIRKLQNVEYEKFGHARASLLRFSEDQQLFMVVHLNYEDYQNLLKRYFVEYKDNPSMDYPRFESVVLDINRHILNYLSAIRAFLDHSETNLKRRYGKDSQRVRHFKEACSQAYDSSFSYRFLYGLRSYVQHCGLPLGRLTLDSKLVGPSPEDVRHTMAVQFNRHNLLANFSWGSRLTEEIKQLPLRFDIGPHITEMMKCLERLNLILIGDDLPELIQSAEYIQKLVTETKGKLGVPCIFRIEGLVRTKKSKVGQLSLGIEWIPLHIVEMVMHIKRSVSIKD